MCFKGEAMLLIGDLPVTGENFARAWTELTRHYENKRLLVRSYLARFSSLPALKGESASELRKLFHGVINTVSSLESIGRPITSNEDYFVHSVVERLDTRSRREWEHAIKGTTEPPAYSTLRAFLNERLQTLEALQPSKANPESASSKSDGNLTRSARVQHATNARKSEKRRGRCSVCQLDHFVMFCDAYTSKTAAERKQHAETSGLCLNCLGKHKASECSSKKACSACGERHHTTLHDACKEIAVAKTSHATWCAPEIPTTVLLATARVYIKDRFGVSHVARALVDQGSESSLVTEALVQCLRLARALTSVTVFGVGGKRTEHARGKVALQLSSLGSGTETTVTALLFPRLTIYDGGIKADTSAWNHFNGLELADLDFMRTDPVDILLGADVFAVILQEGLRKGEHPHQPAQKTSFGWIISGAVSSATTPSRALTHGCTVEEELSALVRQYWKQEELLVGDSHLAPEEQRCEDFFRQTHARQPDGRYMVRLPTVEPLPDLAATKRAALRVLLSLERRFVREPRLQQRYKEFMGQYEDLGHMSPAGLTATTRISYLPHHGVMREASSSTKLRVFNGSSLVPSGASLNKNLLVGPNLLPQLTDVLLRWRRHRYVLATDVEKMYRQILVHPEDRDLQRILWRDNNVDDIREYRLNTVTYGLASAPFLAMRTLRQLAEDEKERYPQGATIVRRDVYMDDVLTGADSMEQASTLQQQLHDLCLAGGFPLRKWSSNDSAILLHVPVEHRMQREIREWRPQESHSMLGLRWHPAEDCFSFATCHITVTQLTKRTALSLASRLFDPLGWLAPAVVRAKISLQQLWLQGLEWDDTLSDALAKQWLKYQAELPLLERIRVPRWVTLYTSTRDLEVHGFADASETACAAVVYLRVKKDASWDTALLAAKTKVAPVKQVSLPRLELCAATLLVRLASRLLTTLNLPGTPLHLWSDSTVTLGWIRGHPSRWQTYVANQVSEIQTAVPNALWHHVPGNENPADCTSRGLSPGELVEHKLWWQGPAWLKMDISLWPNAAGLTKEEMLPERRVRAHTTEVTPKEPEELLRFSALSRLLRVTAWCRRWFYRRESQEQAAADPASVLGGSLSTAEIDSARRQWVRLIQAEEFKTELLVFQQGRTLPRSSQLNRLTPFLDSHGLLRVGGRLKHALLAYDERHPIILPRESHFTRLVVDACHLRSLHGGVQLTLGLLRQQYWVSRGRAVVKQRIHQCVTCTRWRAAIPQQLMGSLPRERVTPARPFLHTGVDYAGPVLLRTTKGRDHRAYKAFIAIFVCLSTRAVHLEVVSDYTADTFLAALRRFTSRRGVCNTFRSDCGTNFVGADSQLRALFAATNPERRKIEQRLSEEHIQWKFNPPSAPHFGGIWEAAVKSVKHHLRRVLGDATLTYEEMSTLLAQIEACLNSRPLQALSDDPDDLAALTPGHFLVGSALAAIPEPSLSD